ncbi:U-box domain-containing protein 4 [Phtheirospermum japonicum]|uniref:U-box domain-containing protein 4 n=1 Tax=Phtheirospermum japonicum TaxID=374723 RepID=A0A830CXQ9_9LAMI|nr:U-box domain-containing protein 4 [Phtheirospermum japonicum]
MAFLNLSLHESNKNPIVTAGAVKSLIYVLKMGTVTSKQNAACALPSVALTDENKLSIGACGVIPPLFALLINGSSRGKKDALTTLYKLCSARLNKERPMSAGAVRPLVDLVAKQGIGLAEKAMVVLGSLAGIEMGREAIVVENGITTLVEAMEDWSDKLKEFAVLTLLQMCDESICNRGLLVSEGGIVPLVGLSHSGTAKAKHKKERKLHLQVHKRVGRLDGVLELEPMNPYNRLLVHRLADMFGRSEALSFGALLSDINVEKYEPSGENEWYFFTWRQKKYKNGLRPDRAAGDGFWRASGGDDEIGYKRSLTYLRGKKGTKSGVTKTGWLMTEYRVKNAPSPVQTQGNTMRMDNWVICKMYKTNRKQVCGSKRNTEEMMTAKCRNTNLKDQYDSSTNREAANDFRNLLDQIQKLWSKFINLMIAISEIL